MTLRAAVGGDDAGFHYARVIINDLRSNTAISQIIDVGPKVASDKAAYANYAIAAAEAVARNEVDRTVLICGTGLGVAVAANKVAGVRAATAHDSFSVERSIKSNNAQVLCLGQRVIGIEVARRLVREWLGYQFDPGCPRTFVHGHT